MSRRAPIPRRLCCAAKRLCCSGLSIAALFGSQVRGEESAPKALPSQSKLEAPLPKSMPRPEGDLETIPIDWPTVLELARASNLEISLAGEKVHEAHIKLALARRQWVPSLKMGVTWGHHDGRIQEIQGAIVEASKSSLGAGGFLSATVDPQKIAVDVLRAKQQVMARSSQLDQATRQSLQDASLAYADLVTAQAGAAIAAEVTQLIGELVDRSEQLLKQGVGTQQQVLSNQGKYKSQLQSLELARQHQLAASARLVQLLSLPAGTRLFASDDYLVPVSLVNEKRSEMELIGEAQNQGPGLAEVAALLSSLEQQQQQLRRIALLPTVEGKVAEGAFGGGPSDSYEFFSNRTDMAVNVYWDVLKVVGTAKTRELFDSHRRQAMLQHEQLLQRLAAGVTVALYNARKANERLQLAENEIDLAIQGYDISHARMIAGEAISFEVFQAIAALGMARKNYLDAVSEYNKAQIQLQYLIGFEPKATDLIEEEPVKPESPDGAAIPNADRGPDMLEEVSAEEPVVVPPMASPKARGPSRTKAASDEKSRSLRSAFRRIFERKN